MTAQRLANDTRNPLERLHDYGQAVWLDFLSQRFIAEGRLTNLIVHDGLTGVTSNPSIFEKAIAGSADYDPLLNAVEAEGDCSVMSLYERLAVADIRHAADALRPVYEATKRQDGYVSLEVSPYLAMNTEATIAEARRLWQAVGRDNLMIKVPATAPGLPAIRQLIGEGINVNITLLFSQQVYEEVAEAYLAGVERLVEQGGDPARIASVASFFVSRIDVAVDKLIAERTRNTGRPDEKMSSMRCAARSRSPMRSLPINATSACSPARGGRNFAPRVCGSQRLLWASTGTKNPAYSDVLYVEELIAADTVNTLPLATMDAFRDHGKVRASLEENVDEAERMLATLARSGISIEVVTDRLVEEGVQLFADAFDKLLGAVARKRAARLGDQLDSQTSMLAGPELGTAVAGSLEEWRQDGKVRRLWAGDARCGPRATRRIGSAGFALRRTNAIESIVS